MPIAAHRDDLSRLIRDNQAQLVEVLPRAEDDWASAVRDAVQLSEIPSRRPHHPSSTEQAST